MTFRISWQDFDDYDRFRETLWGWDTEVTQLSRGPIRVRWSQIAYDDLTLCSLRLNRHISDRMAIEPDRFCFVICLEPKIFCGLQIPAGSIVIFSPGREYRSILYEGFESFEITMSAQVAAALDLPVAEFTLRQLAPERCVISISRRMEDRFRALSRQLFSRDSATPCLGNDELWAAAIREHALKLLVIALRSAGVAGNQLSPAPIQGWMLTARVLDFIDRHPLQALTVRQVSEAIGCTNRALQMALQTTLGVTPSQYPLARRLHFARSDLISGHPGLDSVTRVAAEHHFFHFGRFSRCYCSLFGEYPSRTLHRTRLALHSAEL